MRSDIATSKLDEVADITDSLHKTPKYSSSGYPMVRCVDLLYGPLRLQRTAKVSKEVFDEFSRRYSPKKWDIIITRVGANFGDTSFVDETEFCLGQNTAAITPRINPRYLYHVLNSPFLRQQMNILVAGAAQPTLSLKAIKNLEIPRFSFKTEEAIASILGGLNDRITLLRETNETLNAIAQALFKSWFVDFDPVRLKQQGRALDGIDEATAELFSDSFEESGLGLVPKGWRIGILGDFLSLRNERTKPSDLTASLPYVPIESISSKSPFLEEYKSGEEANSSLILFHKGDVLFGAMRPYFHKVCSAPFDGVTRTTVFTLTPKNILSAAFALFQAYQDTTIEYATQHSEGSTIPYAKWSGSLEKMPVVVPPKELQERYSEVVSGFIECANENLRQSQTLSILRDTLLPSLISGQLRLPEAEGFSEEL